MANKRIAIIGAGPAGLMAAEVLSQYAYEIDVFEQNLRLRVSFDGRQNGLKYFAC